MTVIDLIQLLEKLNPDTLIGFSDLNAEHLLINKVNGCRSIHIVGHIHKNGDGQIVGKESVDMFVLTNGE